MIRSRLAVRITLTLLVLLVAGMLLSILRAHRPEDNAALPRCPVNKYTGLHCPGCGSTRCTYALLDGRPAEAWRKNPLLCVALPFLGIALARMWWNWIRGGPFRDAKVDRWSLRLAPAVLIVIVVFTILRNVPGPDRWLAPH